MSDGQKYQKQLKWIAENKNHPKVQKWGAIATELLEEVLGKKNTKTKQVDETEIEKSTENKSDNKLKNNLLVPEMKQHSSQLLKKSKDLQSKVENEGLIDKITGFYEESSKKLEEKEIVSHTSWYYMVATLLFLLAYVVIRLF